MNIALFVVILILIIALFNRCPVPSCERNNDLIYSPSYGRVIEVTSSPEGSVVKIMLILTDVHVQYAPITGQLIGLQHNNGKHVTAKKQHIMHGKTLANENLLYIFHSKEHDCAVGVRQIAGMYARRCVPFIRTGDSVLQQDFIGCILFGSQVNVLLPPCATLLCKVGDKLIGGQTPLAKLKVIDENDIYNI